MYKWKKLMKVGPLLSSDSAFVSSGTRLTGSGSSVSITPPSSPPFSPTPLENEAILYPIEEKKSLKDLNLQVPQENIDQNEREEPVPPLQQVRAKTSPGKRKFSANNVGGDSIHSKRPFESPTRKKRIKTFKETNSPKQHHDHNHRVAQSLQTSGYISQKLLLAIHDDDKYLNPFHCFVRKNIQVFTASMSDISVPAPGRKNRIYLGQVGLRCIHCQNVSSKNRVKRAVCYPSSISRVYSSVSDMKFDHFSACKNMPPDVRAKFLELKNAWKRRSTSLKKLNATTITKINSFSSRSCNSLQKRDANIPSSSTAQYYLDSAKSLGMVDFVGGVFFKSKFSQLIDTSASSNDLLISTSSTRCKKIASLTHLFSQSPPTSDEINLMKLSPQEPQYSQNDYSFPPKDRLVRFIWKNHSSLSCAPKCLEVRDGNEDFSRSPDQVHDLQASRPQQMTPNTYENHYHVSERSYLHEGQSQSIDESPRRAFRLRQNQYHRESPKFGRHNAQATRCHDAKVNIQEQNNFQGKKCSNNQASRFDSSKINNIVKLPRRSPLSFQGSKIQHVPLPSPVYSQQNANTTKRISKRNNTIRLLAHEGDDLVLNPLHCFVRENVEIFVATDQDIAAPSPGRKQKVVIGQVGLRCVHCANSTLKKRVKRAVCYPPTVSGIYHCVSNMKFDHFGACRCMPPKLKEKFLALKKECTRKSFNGSSVSANSGGGSIFTAHYYQTSAVKIGLTDTESGIRFIGPKQDHFPSNSVSLSRFVSSSFVEDKKTPKLIGNILPPRLSHSRQISLDKKNIFQQVLSHENKDHRNDGLSVLMIAASRHAKIDEDFIRCTLKQTSTYIPPNLLPTQRMNSSFHESPRVDRIANNVDVMPAITNFRKKTVV